MEKEEMSRITKGMNEDIRITLTALMLAGTMENQSLKQIIDGALTEDVKEALNIHNDNPNMYTGALGSITLCILAKLLTKQVKWQKEDGKQIEKMYEYLTKKMREFNDYYGGKYE